MPHITVDYSESLTEHFDRRGFGMDLHPLVARTVEGSVTGCRTRFQALDDCVIADGADDVAMVHVEVSLLSGRTPDVKSELSRAVLGLVRDYVKPAGLTVHFSVDIRDLARGCYTNFVHREASA